MKDNKSVANWKVRFFQLMKEQVITHLRNISNQEISVPIPGVYNDTMVKNLISEVEKETLIGVKYMTEWAKTINLIQKIKTEN